MDYAHCMLDLETMGTGWNSAIVSIGAVAFNPDEYQPTEPVFDRNIHLRSAVDAGLTMDADTVLWWMKQSRAARERVLRNRGTQSNDLRQVLLDFSLWFKEKVNPFGYLWANGAAFDPVILENAYTVCKLPRPWKYSHVRDMRTIVQLGVEHRIDTSDINHIGTEHVALDDALYQARVVMKIWQGLTAKPESRGRDPELDSLGPSS